MARARIGQSFAVDNPLLRLKLSTGRLKLVLVLIALAFSVLGVRAVQVQMFQGDKLQTFGARSYETKLKVEASRGRILDRNGVVLAWNLPTREIVVNPKVFKRATDQQRDALRKILALSKQQLQHRLDSPGRYFAYLKRGVPAQRAEVIMALKVPGVSARKQYKRHYPEGEIASHVVGITSGRNNVGQEGVELAAEQSLKAVHGQRRVMRDRLGRVIADLQSEGDELLTPKEIQAGRSADGSDQYLSIDSRLQFLAHHALRDAIADHKAKSGSVVVIDVETGELLVVANWPSYDPNDRSQLIADTMRNRVVTDSFEPGSTMKPFTAALALELRKVTPHTIIETAPGRLTIGPDTISDTHYVGAITVEQAIQKSSNIALAKMALDMQPQQMWEFFSALGFGLKPDIRLPGVIAGVVRPFKKWRPIEQATMSYGHGMSVSLLQLARAYMIFARDGEIVPISIRRQPGPVAGQKVISSKTAKAVRKMLEMAAGHGGTAAQSHIVGYRIAGKTGTSRKLDKGVYVKKYQVTFVGFAPASNPRIIVAASINEPSGKKYYAGDVVAPLFAKVASDALRQLRVAPDAPVAEILLPETELEASQ